ncbi:MAG: hypothetical protein ACK5DE_03850 [Bacteroidota bacterium]|jgi:hypothetical protein
MATSGIYYLNAPSLASATSVFDDASLTTISADGYYAEGVIVRQQLDGVLLPQQICPSYIPFDASVSAVSSATCCLLGETETYYSPSGIINLGDTITTDSCATTTLEEGFYRASGSISGGNDWFEVNSFGVVIAIGNCPATSATLSWTFTDTDLVGTMDLYVNGIIVESRSASSSGTYTVYEDDVIGVVATATGCTSPSDTANAICLGIINDSSCLVSSTTLTSTLYTVLNTDLGTTLNLDIFTSCDAGCL